MTTVTKVRYYNQCRFGSTEEWEDMCHGHSTLEEAILCQERAHKKGLESLEAIVLIALTETLSGRLQARIVRRTAQISDEVVEEGRDMYSAVKPKVEPEVADVKQQSTSSSKKE